MTKQLIFIFLTITSLLLHGQVSSRSSDDEAKRQLQGFERIDNYNYNPLSIKQGDNGKYGLIDVSGNLVVAYRYGEIFWKKSTQTFLVCDSTIWDSKQVGVLNSRGMPLLDRVYQVIDFGDGALFLYSKEREKWIILQYIDGNYGASPVRGGAHHFIHEGKIIIYDRDHENNLKACVFNRWGEQELDWSTQDKLEQYIKDHRITFEIKKKYETGYYTRYSINPFTLDTLRFFKFKEEPYYNGTKGILDGRYITQDSDNKCKTKGFYQHDKISGLWVYEQCETDQLRRYFNGSISTISLFMNQELHIRFNNETEEALIQAYNKNGDLTLKGNGTIEKGKVTPYGTWTTINDQQDTSYIELGERIPNWKTLLSIQQVEGGKYQLVNPHTNKAVTPKYGSIIRKEEMKAYLVGDSITEGDLHVGLLDSLGKKIIPPKFQLVGFGHEAVFLFSHKKKKLLEIILTEPFPMCGPDYPWRKTRRKMKRERNRRIRNKEKPTRPKYIYQITLLYDVTGFERQEYALIVYGEGEDHYAYIYDKNGSVILYWCDKTKFDKFTQIHRLGSQKSFSLQNSTF